MLNLRFAVLLVLAPASLSAQSRWKAIDDTTRPQSLYLDLLTLSPTSDGVSAWVKRIGGTAGDTTVDGRLIHEHQLRYIVKCATREYASVSGISYDSTGRALASWNDAKTAYTFDVPVPDTYGEMIVNAICLEALKRKLPK